MTVRRARILFYCVPSAYYLIRLDGDAMHSEIDPGVTAPQVVPWVMRLSLAMPMASRTSILFWFAPTPCGHKAMLFPTALHRCTVIKTTRPCVHKPTSEAVSWVPRSSFAFGGTDAQGFVFNCFAPTPFGQNAIPLYPKTEKPTTTDRPVCANQINIIIEIVPRVPRRRFSLMGRPTRGGFC